MDRPKIKVIEKGGIKRVFIDGVEQKGVMKIETEVLPMEVTAIKISYYTDKFGIVQDKEDINFQRRYYKNIEILMKVTSYLKEIILDERMPGDLANEMQENICKILREEE